MSHAAARQEHEAPDTGHNYDGIREYDNRLPNWWLATLYLTIIFAFGYWAYYHVLSMGPLQHEAYLAEMEEAARAAEAHAASRGAATDESLAAMISDAAAMDEARATFGQYCAACHAANGEGSIGPNLTDAYSIHGHRPTEILKVIGEGVPAKGMPAWGDVLGTRKVEQLAAFVASLEGKNLPGKAPEGEPRAGQ
ncbi:MAG TPA: cbb3-type cytochrome c oxidase N-terminal domain-containing protein [Vulgatibacter sp.]|nr:cbb3-type cytochrome c oxidase N-terminal domain-containing protein [Vulgatibacter sp.]